MNWDGWYWDYFQAEHISGNFWLRYYIRTCQVQFSVSIYMILKRNVITSKALLSPPRPGWWLWNICVTNDHGYVPLVVNTSQSFPSSWLITGFVTRLTRRVSLVEQELLTLSQHMSSPPVFSGVRVTRSLVFCVVLCRSLFVLLYFFFWYCAVCSSSIYGLWLPLWYLHNLLTHTAKFKPLHNV